MRQDLENLLDNLLDSMERTEKIYITSHPSADPDSIASLIAISYLLKIAGVRENPIYLNHGNIAATSKKLVELGLSRKLYKLKNRVEGMDSSTLIILDAPTCRRADIDCMLFSRVFIIDHHALGDIDGEYSKESNRFFIYRDEYHTSTTEIAVQILKIYMSRVENLEIPRDIATAILSGIVYDTKALQSASIIALDSTLFLAMHGASVSEALKLIHTDMALDERIARVKGMMRTEAYRSGDTIVCISHVGAHESSLAHLLIVSGCDLAVVLSDRNDHIRISARCSERLCRESIDLEYLLFKKLSEIFKASYGGHRKAGVASIRGENIEIVKGRILNILDNILDNRLRRLHP